MRFNLMKKLVTATALALSSVALAGDFPVDFDAAGMSSDEYRFYETAPNFNHYANRLGDGVNKFTHMTTTVSVENQIVVRTNNDTLYSLAVVDTRKGATFTLPDTGNRYISAIVFDEYHYPYGMIHKPGEHKIEVDTNYAFVLIRTAFDGSPEDTKYVVEQIQPIMVISAASETPYKMPADFVEKKPILDKINEKLRAIGAKLDSYSELYSEKAESKADPKAEWNGLLATSVAWGIIPATESTFLMDDPKLGTDQCFSAAYQVPPYGAFWSITVYDANGFLFSNTHSIINDRNVKMNKDGTFTVSFGSAEQCGEVANRLDTTDGWNLLMRVYQADMDKLAEYELPTIKQVKSNL